jgi:hypothetical protein
MAVLRAKDDRIAWPAPPSPLRRDLRFAWRTFSNVAQEIFSGRIVRHILCSWIIFVTLRFRSCPQQSGA